MKMLNADGITVLSLFDGMSCGQIALKLLGVLVKKFYASEIDKFAMQQTQHNFPDTIQLGSVILLRHAMVWGENTANKFYSSKWISDATKDRFTQLRNIDWSTINLILAGSPCQGFSFAGKQLAFDDPRSKLFFMFSDILNHIKRLNPDVKFLLENVDMKRSHMKVISDYCGVFPVNINSNLVSAQNRNRWYWTNIRTKQIGLFGEIHSDIPQPKDRGILLRDILDKEVDEKYYLSEKGLSGIINHKETNRSKGNGFGASYSDGNSKCNTILSRYYKDGKEQLILQLGRGFNKGGLHQDKTPTLTKNSWEQNNLVIQLNQSKESGGKQPYQQNRVYADYGKSPCLDTDSGRKSVLNQHRIRRLTPKEVSRLQTIPEDYEWIVSDTQIYKQCGNGWTVEVIAHILSFMFVDSYNQIKQGQLF